MSDQVDTGIGYEHEPITTIPFERGDEAQESGLSASESVNAIYIALAIVFVGIVGGTLLATVFRGAWQ